MDSVWRKSVDLPKFEKLKGDLKSDVLIIGGGAAGLLTAYFLQNAGVNCVLVEKERICGGVTQNTTAKITFQHGLIYNKIFKKYGKEKAVLYLHSNKQALEEYEKISKLFECDFEKKDNFVYSVDNPFKIEKELSALDKIDYKADFCENLKIPVKTSGAVKFNDQAQFNPLKFFAGLSEHLNIYENTFVREMQDNTAVTDYGKIYADNVIVTTHFPFINKHGWYFIKMYQHRSYVSAFENAPDFDGMYVDESDKGLSFRNYGDLLLLGGGGHRTGKNGGDWNELRSFAKEKFPEANEKYFWATQDCLTLDGIPYIGRYSKNTTGLYTATGFNKWGMTGSMVSALLLTDLIMNRKNEFTELYNPSRNIFHPQLAVNGFESVVNLINPFSKRCPHLGCALKWNKSEHSWDCPCHGSRFAENGKLLDNPANGDLNKKL